MLLTNQTLVVLMIWNCMNVYYIELLKHMIFESTSSMILSPADWFFLTTVEQSNAYVELPPELCSIIMSPISVSTFYTFSFASAIMHRIESLLIASSLKKMHADYCNQNAIATTKVPTIKVTLMSSHYSKFSS